MPLPGAPAPLDAREQHGAALLQLPTPTLLVFGGRASPARPFGDLWRFDRQQGWRAIVDAGGRAPCPRWGHSMTAVGSQEEARVVVYGGRDAQGVFGGRLHLLSLEGGKEAWTWSEIASMGNPPLPPLFLHTASCLGGRLLLWGGMTDLTGRSVYPGGVLVSLDDESGSHTHVAGDAGKGRYAHAAAVVDGNEVWVAGGMTAEASGEGEQQRPAVLRIKVGAGALTVAQEAGDAGASPPTSCAASPCHGLMRCHRRRAAATAAATAAAVAVPRVAGRRRPRPSPSAPCSPRRWASGCRPPSATLLPHGSSRGSSRSSSRKKGEGQGGRKPLGACRLGARPAPASSSPPPTPSSSRRPWSARAVSRSSGASPRPPRSKGSWPSRWRQWTRPSPRSCGPRFLRARARVQAGGRGGGGAGRRPPPLSSRAGPRPRRPRPSAPPRCRGRPSASKPPSSASSSLMEGCPPPAPPPCSRPPSRALARGAPGRGRAPPGGRQPLAPAGRAVGVPPPRAALARAPRRLPGRDTRGADGAGAGRAQRRSQVRLLFPPAPPGTEKREGPDSPGWVTVKENGLAYSFDSPRACSPPATSRRRSGA